MKILLIGGEHFIAKNFAEKYGSRYEIFAPTAEEADFNNISSASRYFDTHEFDCVCFIATECAGCEKFAGDDALITFKNVQYFSVLHGVKKLLVLSDASDLGTGSVENATEESFGLEPKNGYGLSRYLITKLAMKDKITTVLRLFNVYGKYCDVAASKTMELIARGVTGKKTATIERDRELSSIYIDDLLKITAAFIDGDIPKGVYNVASDKPLKLTDVARSVRRLAAKDFRTVDVELLSPDLEPSLTADISKLASVIEKLRFTAHSAGIKAVYEHLLKHKSQARPRPV